MTLICDLEGKAQGQTARAAAQPVGLEDCCPASCLQVQRGTYVQL